jgi:glycerol-3-phosphate O-acyltransferase / dihydroxyacetone phosphate acyltransferase
VENTKKHTSSETTAADFEAPDSIRALRIWDMIFLQRGSFFRQIIHAAISIALRLFFRRIETSNAAQVPKEGAIIFVLNHPNGLVDPALVFCSLPRRVSFLAKSTLFKIPVIGFLIKQLEALPVYRQIDAGEYTRKNLQTFEVCHELLARGRCIAIFPEGISHDATKLKPMKTGAARIALGALAVGKESNELLKNGLKIMSVGLFYTSKTTFRSEALIRFGEIFEVERVALDENGEPPREAVQELTGKIEKALRRVTLNTENYEELNTVTKAEALFSSIYKTLIFRQPLTQTFLQMKNLAERFARLEKQNPEKISDLREKVEKYESDLKKSGLTLEGLSVLQHPVWYVTKRLILRGLLIILLAPPSIIGAIIHAPAYLFSNFIGLMFKSHGADAAGSTYKILAACLFMPLTWLIATGMIFYFFGWQIALISLPVMISFGYIALRISEELIDMTVWIKASWLLLRERGLFLRLLLRRRNLQKEIENLIMKSPAK